MQDGGVRPSGTYVTPESSKFAVMVKEMTMRHEFSPLIYYYAPHYANTFSDSQEYLRISHFDSDTISSLPPASYFGPKDMAEIEKIKFPPAIRDHIISRIALKNAVCEFVKERQGRILTPKDFYCTHNQYGQPIIERCKTGVMLAEPLFVSLAHKDYRAVVAVADRPVGVDLEKIEEKSAEFLELAYTTQEITLLRKLNSPEAAIRFWIAKEAVAKKSGFGLQGKPQSFEITKIEGKRLTIASTSVRVVKVEADYLLGWTLT